MTGSISEQPALPGGITAFRRDPYPVYARARRTPGVVYEPELGAWLVSRYDDVREVLRRPDDFSSKGVLRPDVLPGPHALAEMASAPGGSPTVVSSDGAAHQRYRAPLVKGLSPTRVAALAPFADERAEALVDGFAEDGRVELVEAYAKRLPGEVIGRVLGLDAGDVPQALSASHRAEELLFQPMPPDEQVRAAREVAALRHVFDRYARSRRESPRDDMITEMVRALAPGDGEPTDEQRNEVVSNLANFLLAGHLTTTALIGTAVLNLLRHRDQWELLCERPELAPAAVEEAARFDAPVQAFHRTVARPVTLAGVELPAGASVLVAFGSANRDETRFDRPDVFDITRRPVRHVAFGHGVHACPGSQLAREQVRVTLETLARRLPGLRLAPGEPVVMQPTLIHRSPEALHLVW
ncbi:cytochrome P450 [Sphaerisporangium fuscum]|uniref:cytochrome P450 n=1 Tax=Sphaerisporangium fuscum TaxID=2835868 RepID=UPI0027E3A848|nr:cytochrome P450 [Sphaerisporangium fuscum]